MKKEPDNGSFQRNWRDIRQEGRQRPTTPEARKRRMTRTLKLGALAVAAGILVGGVGFGLYFTITNAAPMQAPAAANKLEEVAFQTDGFLNRDWFIRHFELSPDTVLMDLDLADIKARLEAEPQIREARVERQLPGTLRVYLAERAPLLRARVSIRGKIGTLVVARDGTVFEPAGYPAHVLRQLPYIGGVRFSRQGEGYAPVWGIAEVASLLDTARLQYPELAADWRSVYLTDFQEDTPVVKQTLKVQSDRYGEILFRPDAIENQLWRLAGIVADHKRRPQGELAAINLTLSTQTVVRYENR